MTIRKINENVKFEVQTVKTLENIPKKFPSEISPPLLKRAQQ